MLKDLLSGHCVVGQWDWLYLIAVTAELFLDLHDPELSIVLSDEIVVKSVVLQGVAASSQLIQPDD